MNTALRIQSPANELSTAPTWEALEEAARRRTEVVMSWQSESLTEYANTLSKRYRAHSEAGLLERMRTLMRSGESPNSRATYLCALVRDFRDPDRILDGAFGGIVDRVLVLDSTLCYRQPSGTSGSEAAYHLYREAARLLELTDTSLTAIACECGPDSESYWNNLFGLRRVYSRPSPRAPWNELRSSDAGHYGRGSPDGDWFPQIHCRHPEPDPEEIRRVVAAIGAALYPNPKSLSGNPEAGALRGACQVGFLSRAERERLLA